MENSNVTPLHRGIVAPVASKLSRTDLCRTASRRKRHSEEHPVTVPAGKAPLRGYGNYSTRELARMCGVSKGTVRRWRRTGEAPAVMLILLELLHRGPLELVSPEWADWSIRNGKLCNIDGHEYTPGEVWSIGLLHQRIAALEATVRELRAAADVAETLRNHRERSHRESKSIGQAEALCSVVFSLLSRLTESEDGFEPALDGNSDLVRRLQLSAAHVAIQLHHGGQPGPDSSEAAIEAALAEFKRPRGEPEDS